MLPGNHYMPLCHDDLCSIYLVWYCLQVLALCWHGDYHNERLPDAEVRLDSSASYSGADQQRLASH